MNIVAATRSYEKWAAARIPLIAADLRRKHELMAAAPFSFLRGTFYRWAQLFPEICPDLATAPRLLAVGDLHIENFGTWRDAEGRLVWGINDFDEAFPLPYANDLVRLATSALMAIETGAKQLSIGPDAACAAILAGYTNRMHDGQAKPMVLEEAHPELREIALGQMREPVKFWAKLTALRTAVAPKPVTKLLRKQLPDGAQLDRIAHRLAGMGCLGRERYVALAQADGGWVAREAKRMLPSACLWAAGKGKGRSRCEEIASHASLVTDPFFSFRAGWVLRRLAPHCSRIELDDLPARRDERQLLEAMGAETANTHLGMPGDAKKARRDLTRRASRDGDWLYRAARKMARATLRDWREWRHVARRHA